MRVVRKLPRIEFEIKIHTYKTHEPLKTFLKVNIHFL